MLSSDTFRSTVPPLAVFALTLLVSTLGYERAPATSGVVVATVVVAARSDVALPNQIAELPRRIVAPAPSAAPVPDAPQIAVTASWYGPGFFENRLPCWLWLQAEGQPIQFLPDTWGVAHKTLPCGTMVTLTHGTKTVTVPVVDRGPYVEGRELDLSPRVKAALGCTDLCALVMQIP